MIIRNKHLFLLLMLLAVTSCSSFSDLKSTVSEGLFGREPVNPPAELDSITESYKTKVDWSSNLGDLARFSFTPAIHSDVIYACNHQGEVYKLDAKTGKKLWSIHLNTPLSGGVGITGNLVLVGSAKAELIALDQHGKKKWVSLLSSEIQGVPRYVDGLVIVRTSDQHIYGIDAVDGRRKWVYERTTPSLALKTYAGIVVDGGAVYAGFPGGKLIALRADNGKTVWEGTVAQPRGVTEIERIADVTSLPFVSGPVIYAVAYQGKVAALDRRTGQAIWERDISSYSGLTEENNKLYVSHASGSVYSLYSENGKTFWRQGNLEYRELTTPLPVAGVIALGDVEGYIHLLSKDEGKFVGRIHLGSDPIVQIVLGNHNNQLIAFSRSGHLYAVSIQ